MMDIRTQIITIFVSFIFGIIFSLQLSLTYKYLYSNKKIFKVIFSFLIVLVNTLLYFILLKKFNDGILHVYGIIFIIIGFIAEIFVKSFIVKKIHK